ncbi:MAG: glycosyltransferase family 4 protein [Clostridiales bacterium]|nr:glycosyltransferase family 4 protein [Clostridiales bacterium]
MEKVYFFANRTCKGAVGGGRGVVYKLYDANKKYGLIKGVNYLFTDINFDDDSSVVVRSMPDDIAKKGVLDCIKKFVNKNGALSTLKYVYILNKATRWIRDLGNKYNFGSDDVYIFHDVDSAIAFQKNYSYTRTMLVFHQQGSQYNEWVSFGGRPSRLYQKYLNSIFIRCCDKISCLGFPSEGARESLMESESELKETVEGKKYAILYNGFTPSDETENVPTDETKKIVEALRNFSGFKFITVSTLNEAKGVERIPAFLNLIKQKYGDFLWVVIGTGNKEEKLTEEIKKNGIKKNVVWVKHAIPHSDILKLFSETDFYILFHRYSIFDFATIEAMAYGNVPVLTPIGGNKEMIVGNSGVFVDDIKSIDSFSVLLDENTLEELKTRNIKLQESKFSEKAFLEGYSVQIVDLRSEDKVR